MKKLGFILIILILETSVSMAQYRGGQRNYNPEERAKQQTETLKEKLELNKEQEKKVYALNIEAGKEFAEMRKEMQNGGGFNDNMREKMIKMREEQNKKMKEILTDSQYEKYETYLKERRERRGQGRR